MDDREDLARLIAASTQRCAVCKDPSREIEILADDDEERTKLVGLCAVCGMLLHASPGYARISFYTL